MTPLNQQVEKFEWLFVIIMLAITLLLFVSQQWIVGSALQRLDWVRQDMQRLARGEVQALTTDVPLEVGPLVESFNHLLGLFQQRLEHSRKGLGNLSHALKGPLSLLQQQLESEALQNHLDLKASMQQQIDRVEQLMEREMRRARIAGTGISGGHFDAAKEMPALVGVLQQIYRDKSLSINYQIPEKAVLPVDREDMLELLGNLLDNACKWSEGKVNCQISQSDSLDILVEDDGPGVSEEALVQLAERGVRLDETIDGHGLGLAITKDMIKLYGGEIIFTHSAELGGLCVRVQLPL
jgi:signal transduction histidine kinase